MSKTPEQLRKINEETYSKAFNKNVISHIIHDLNSFKWLLQNALRHAIKDNRTDAVIVLEPLLDNFDRHLGTHENPHCESWTQFLNKEWKKVFEEYKVKEND